MRSCGSGRRCRDSAGSRVSGRGCTASWRGGRSIAQVLKNRRRREQQDDRLPEAAAPDAADDDTLAAAKLQQLVATLSPAQRSAVTMFYYEGRSVEQVAELLNMPENTVKTHLSRARAVLRAAWSNEMGEDA